MQQLHSKFTEGYIIIKYRSTEFGGSQQNFVFIDVDVSSKYRGSYVRNHLFLYILNKMSKKL